MSDQNEFGTVATQAPPATAVAEEASKGGSKAMLLVGGVAVVVLAIFAYFLFGIGGGEPEATGTVPKPVVPGGSTSTDTSKSGGDTAKSDSKSDKPDSADVESRNPFQPLEVDAPATDTTGTTTDTTTDTTTPPVETVSLGLVSVNDTKGLVTATVDSKTYKNLAEGDTFATNFQVYAIFNDSCAGFLYGDDSFALCEGKTTQVAKL